MVKGSILIVDDDEVIRKSLWDTLTQEGYEVLVANDGASGLIKALEEKPDLVVIDVEMPVMNGMDMLKKLRESGDWGKSLPAIILTNYDTTDKVLQGVIEDKPSMYILKSQANPAEIVEHIREKLGPNNLPITPSEV